MVITDSRAQAIACEGQLLCFNHGPIGSYSQKYFMHVLTENLQDSGIPWISVTLLIPWRILETLCLNVSLAASNWTYASKQLQDDVMASCLQTLVIPYWAAAAGSYPHGFLPAIETGPAQSLPYSVMSGRARVQLLHAWALVIRTEQEDEACNVTTLSHSLLRRKA